MEDKLKFEHMQNIELTDGVIKLRPFRFEDAEAHLAGEDEEQVKWVSGGKSTLETVQKWIKENQEYWQASGTKFNFAIESNEENKLVGMVEANTDSSSIEGLQDGDANISYSLYPEARGKGYVTHAVALVADFLKEKGLKRAVIRVNPQNEASFNVPKRSGFQEIGAINTKEGKLTIFIKEL